MKSVDRKIFKDKKLLTRFVRQLCSLPDTPSLIQFVAGDEDYLRLCSRIVNASAGDSQVLRHLSVVCRKHGFDFQVLKERLTPVGQALGLALSSEQIDYYELLGISSDARKADIKKAFRQKARKVHPDTSDQMTDGGQDFINLKAAYQTLSDPVLRRQYDENLHDVNTWQEKANHIHRFPRLNPLVGGPQSGPDETGFAFHWAGIQRSRRRFRRLNPLISQDPNQNQSATTRIYYQLGVLFLVMIIAVFIFDFLYRQNSIFDGDYTVKQRQVQKPKDMKEGSERTANSRTRSENTKVKLLPNASNNTRKIYPADDMVGQANPKSNAEVSADGSK